MYDVFGSVKCRRPIAQRAKTTFADCPRWERKTSPGTHTHRLDPNTEQSVNGVHKRLDARRLMYDR